MTLTDYAQPFSADEVAPIEHHIFDTERLKKRHERCIELLEALRSLHRRKSWMIESIGGFAGVFPETRRKYVNRVDTLNRCIKRMEQRYNQEMWDLYNR